MKKLALGATALGFATLLVACDKLPGSTAALENPPGAEDSVERQSYLLGRGAAAQRRLDMEALFEQLQTREVDLDAFRQGMAAASLSEELSEDELATFTAWADEVQQLRVQIAEQEQQRANQLAQQEAVGNRVIAEELLRQFGAQDGVLALATATSIQDENQQLPALLVQVVEQGQGPVPQATSTVRVRYTGQVPVLTQNQEGEAGLSWRVFDSTEVEGGEPLQIQLNGVIQGWTAALTTLPIGTTAVLFIHPDLGYGNQPIPGGPDGQYLIPPGSLLRFEVQLLELVDG